jgi:hypothetical protein
MVKKYFGIRRVIIINILVLLFIWTMILGAITGFTFSEWERETYIVAFTGYAAAIFGARLFYRAVCWILDRRIKDKV